MPSEQLYLLEMIVKKIELEADNLVNDTSNLSVGFKFAQIINFEVDTIYFSQPEIDDNNGRTIMMNYGKTFLFVCKPADLRQLLQSDPYQITLYDGNKTLGFTSETWKREFSEMIKFFESLGIVKSTAMEDLFELQNEQGVTTAQISIFLRMSCFGQNLQTMFQIKQDGKKQEYIFRQRNTSRTFKVEKYADERCQPLVAPLYSAITDTRSGPGSQVNMKENVSLTQLFERDNVMQKDSDFRPPDAVTFEDGIRLDFQDDYDKVSICFRPSENKFFDLLDLISADVKTKDTHTEVTFQRKKVDRVSSFLKSIGGDLKASPNIFVEEDENILEMTADKIEKKLCGNKDCPAVKKFKEYGIGPLATGKSLGTVYGDIEPPVTYGLSHTYGTMREYGPYGVFSRPKQEALPFVARNELAEIAVKPCKIRKEQPNCESKIKQRKKKRENQWHSKTCPLSVERLRGGADNDILMKSGHEEDDGLLMPKSPIIECKSVMEQFDNILAEYKRALGPCGHATCPYAQNLAEDTCKKMCDQPLPPMKKSSSVSCNGDPCEVEGCPYASAPKKKRYPAGCGNPKCAYTKYKLGLLDDDAEMELKFLPPPLAGNCGDPHCKYPFAAPLPPIHWDCPDPLPKGACRNLNCPFQPAPLKKFKTKQVKTGPCGSPMCAFALPQPCGVPTCPFLMRPCPMAEKQKPRKGKVSSSSEENVCQNPECPFSEKNASKDLPDEINDPKFQGEFQDCVNPKCPFKQTDKKKKKSKSKPKETSCGNPQCPSAKAEKKKKGKKVQSDSEDTSICSNPECPASLSKDKKDKNRCQKSSSSESTSVCSDPQCPYAGVKQQSQRKSKGDDTSEDSSSAASCHKNDEDSVCSNPECPEQKARSEAKSALCDQPGCPYSKEPPDTENCNDPNCPYLKPLPSCGIPNCPYEPVPLRYSCKNPKCPSRQVDFKKKPCKANLEESSRRDQDDRDGREPQSTTIIMQTTVVCEEEAPCDASPKECENPDCEMKESELLKGGQSTENREIALLKHKKKGKRKNRGKFVYSIGDTYPGNKVGHKECVTPIFNVPPHMGWLWNVFTPILRMKPRRGWRPGALTKTIAARIRAHRQSKGLGFLKVPTFKQDGGQFDDTETKVTPKPTLQIQKKEGVYWITMNPLKDPFTLVENEDPYMECTPMTFRISKNKKPEEDFCCCDGDAPEHLESSSSSDSELDIEFTPPAGIIHPERFKKRPNVVCCDVQYDPKDFEVAKKKDDKKGKGKGKGKDKKGKGGKGGKGKKGGKKK